MIRASMIRASMIRAYVIRAYVIRAYVIRAYVIRAYVIRAYEMCIRDRTYTPPAIASYHGGSSRNMEAAPIHRSHI